MLMRALIAIAGALLLSAGPASARINPIAAVSGPANVKVGNRATFDASSSKADPAGSIVEYAWDLDADGSFEEVRQGARIAIVPTVPGEQVIAVRVTDDVGATSVASTHYLVEGAPPVARLAAASSAVAGAPVTLDASSSTSPSGAIAGYQWNLDGLGFAAETTQAVMTTTFSEPGLYEVAVRVRDTASGTATVRKIIEVVAPGTALPTGGALGGSAELGIAPLDTVAQRWVDVGSARRFAALGGAARRRVGAVRKGLWVNLMSDRAARFTLGVHLRKADARRLGLRGKSQVAGHVRVAVSRQQLETAGQRAARVVLPARVRRALRAPLRLLVRGVAVDGAGNRSVVSRVFTLRL
jgi:hypothetical protein